MATSTQDQTIKADYTGHFCSPGCRECYREDRAQGLIYGQALIVDATNKRESIAGWYDACYVMGACAYCRGPIANEKTIAKRIKRYFDSLAV